MPALRSSGVAVAVLLAQAGLARAEGPTIEHSAIKCIVAGKYRKMPARFTPPEVAQPRVYFRPEGVPSWYYVEMKPEAALGHVGVLPKATKKLVGQHIEYYVEAASRDFDTGRTPEYDPIVVAKDSECQNDPVLALYSKEPPTAVFPSVPQGFAIGGGVAGGTLAAVIGGGAAVTGAIVLTKDDEQPIPPPVTQPPVTSPPVTNPPVTQPPSLPADVACQADPRQGRAPLVVKFNAQANGGNGTFNFAWTFGDGGSSSQVNPSHTYTAPGVYEARVVATSVDRSSTCSRTVTVLANAFRLTVNAPTTGTGRVTGDGIDCPGDCSEDYAPGTAVTLAASASGGWTFAGWSGDCSGTSTCVVTMDADRTVNANFNPPPTLFPLNVTVGGAGTGTVTGPGGLNCPGTCSQSYTTGTPVALTANPTGGSTFGGWGGDCAGTTGLTCNLVMNGPRNASATFNPAPTFRLTLTVTNGGGGAGRVQILNSTVPDCVSSPPPGTTCISNWPPNTTITLRPLATAGFFINWGGDCAGTSAQQGTLDCILVMSQDRTVTALFDNPTQPTSGQATLVSQLDAPSARTQVEMNGAPLPPVASGLQTLSVSVVGGENRLEARLIEGKAGTWRLDLSRVPGIERGSLRVLAGDALAVGPDSVVFRLSGRAGERVGLAFTRR